MKLQRVTLATEPSRVSGQAEYWLTDVREIGDDWGFEIQNVAHQPVGQFLYQDCPAAKAARALMLKALADAVGVAFGLPEL